MPNPDQNKNAPITKRDKILLGVLGLLYLIPSVIGIFYGVNPANFLVFAIFLSVYTGYTLILSTVAIICCIFCIALMVLSKKIWLKAVGLIAILLPSFILFALIHSHFTD